MLTRPAPLDGMSDDDGLDEFRVTAPREIQTLLKRLIDGAILLNLTAADDTVFTSAIWTIDSSRGTIGFNADPKDPAVHAILASRGVTVVGYLDNVKLQFEIENLMLVHGSRASVLSCQQPRQMYRFQRRNAFRVRPLIRSSPTARFRHPDILDMEMALRVIDVSVGGCALFLPADAPAMNPGVLLPEVRVELDPDTRFEASMRLQHVTAINPDTHGVRCGLEFKRIGNDAMRTLQRYIDLTQKRGKLMALS